MQIRLLRDCQQLVPGELFPRDRRKDEVVEVSPETANRAIGKGLAVPHEQDIRIPDYD